MTKAKLNANALALAGEFATLSQLALRGFDANLTLGNTKNVDILLSDPDSGQMYRLEVKTSSYLTKKGHAGKHSKMFGHCYEWMMSKKHEDIVDERLFYCFVNFRDLGKTSFRFFIVPSTVVATYVKEQHQLWLRDDPHHKDTAMRVFRLSLEKDGYPLHTPSAKQYENDWSFKI